MLEGIAGVASLAALGRQAHAQQPLTLNLKGACSFYPRDFNAANPGNPPIETFDPVEDGTRIVAKIAESIGLQPNFEVLQADFVANAAAVIENQTRYVVYNKNFIKLIVGKADSEWAAWTIMAHEVGHHLNGHTLSDGGSRPPIELEADHFAGFAVHRIGGTLEQALSAYEQLAVEGSETHPGRVDRESAISSGWKQAGITVRGIPGSAETRAAATETLKAIVQQLQSGFVPNVPLSPLMQRTLMREAETAMTSLQPRGQLAGIQLAAQQRLPNSATLYRFQVQFARGPMIWRLWLDRDGTVVGLQYQ